MTTKKSGPIGWNLGTPKPKLTPEMVEAKSREVAQRYGELFVAFGLAVSELADAKDALGLNALAVGVKLLLADGVDRCGDALVAFDVLD